MLHTMVRNPNAIIVSDKPGSTEHAELVGLCRVLRELGPKAVNFANLSKIEHTLTRHLTTIGVKGFAYPTLPHLRADRTGDL